MSIPIDLTGRKAIISGVSTGIGAAIAKCVAQAGCDIAGCGLEATASPGAATFLEYSRQFGRRAFYSRCDLSLPETPAQWLTDAIAQLSGCDIVISNAGQNIFRGVTDCSEADWSHCMNLDLASHWRLCQAAFPHLVKSGQGIVILIGSNHAERTIPGCFPYNVAKAGVQAMVQSLAIEWGPRIRAVGIAPGFIDTPGNDAWFNSFADPAAERAKTEKLHPINRLGEAQEIGALCAFLASDLCSFMTGTTLTVDGGRGALLQDK